MGKRLEQTFLQRKPTNGQQLHKKKIFNITNHQGNANQNYNEVSPHTCQDDHDKQNQQNKREEQVLVGKLEPLCTAVRNVNCAATTENSMQVPQKIKNRTTI